jgi:hypothetical protein
MSNLDVVTRSGFSLLALNPSGLDQKVGRKRLQKAVGFE